MSLYKNRLALNFAYTIGFLLCFFKISGQDAEPILHWENITEIPPFGNQVESLGVAGPIAGIHNNVLLVAGGANFPKPYWDNEKLWHDDIWVFDLENKAWLNGGKLDHALAYSATVSTPQGIIAIGGNNSLQTFKEVSQFQWNPENQKVIKTRLKDLPHPVTYSSAIVLDQYLYVIGGTRNNDLKSATKDFLRLSLNDDNAGWEQLPQWPGPERAFNVSAVQHNGQANCIYLMGGRREASNNTDWDILTDVYEFNPDKYQKGINPWRTRSAMPAARMAGTAIALGQSHIAIISGDDGDLYKQSNDLKEDHPGFSKKILSYNTITDQWFESGDSPQNQLTSHLVYIDEDQYLVSGEIKPRVRSPLVWEINTINKTSTFNWTNLTAIIVYLILLLAIGFYFGKRNKTTEDYFRGGQKVPWWAAGCSIFATMLSSITFMSIPAKSYSTDWLYLLLNMSIIALAPFIIYFILPYFRKLNVTSAYEYLELRFNLATRLFASTSYILFQIGRMAIVMYLPALALTTVTPLSIEFCILLMGVLSILYTTIGGIEAVIWTDTLQTIVLLGGAVLCFIIIIFQLDGGLNEYVEVGKSYDKFKTVEWGWDYTTAVLWVVVIGGVAQNLVPYSSDQGVIQRYMTVSSEKEAAKSIWTNAGLSLIASILFFALGTALFVYYKKYPEAYNPSFQNDAVLPLFITQQLPVGIAGIVIAGIFASAQSTISTSMNSISAVFSTDYIKRLKPLASDKSYLLLAKVVTIISGTLGTVFALLISSADIKSLWDSFISVLGLFGGAMCGLFMLGIFTSRANGKGAFAGAILGVIILWLVQQYTEVSVLLYAFIGIGSSFIFGYLLSFIFKTEKIIPKGLTIYSD